MTIKSPQICHGKAQLAGNGNGGALVKSYNEVRGGFGELPSGEALMGHLRLLEIGPEPAPRAKRVLWVLLLRNRA